MTFIFLEKKALLLLVIYSLQDITQSIVKQLLFHYYWEDTLLNGWVFSLASHFRQVSQPTVVKSASKLRLKNTLGGHFQFVLTRLCAPSSLLTEPKPPCSGSPRITPVHRVGDMCGIPP